MAVTAEAGSVTAAITGRTLTLHLTDDNGSLLGSAAIPADAWAALPSPDGWRTPPAPRTVTAMWVLSVRSKYRKPAILPFFILEIYAFGAALSVSMVTSRSAGSGGS